MLDHSPCSERVESQRSLLLKQQQRRKINVEKGRHEQPYDEDAFVSSVASFIRAEMTYPREYLHTKRIITDTDQVLFYRCPTTRKLTQLMAPANGNGRLLQAEAIRCFWFPAPLVFLLAVVR
jgi:hypothetical protein